MNGKKAKQLRKQSNYDVNSERQYKGKPPVFSPVRDTSTGMVIDFNKVEYGVPFECVNAEYRNYKQAKKDVK